MAIPLWDGMNEQLLNQNITLTSPKVKFKYADGGLPYTWALMESMPALEQTGKLNAINGTPPNMLFPPKGDAFAERNRYAMKIDFEKQPPFFKVSDTHYAATWLLHPDAPKVECPVKNRRIVAPIEEEKIASES